MNRFNSVPVNELHYGTVVEMIPVIPTTKNGVYYDPTKPYRKTFRSLGRGQDGRDAATKLQSQWLTAIMERHNWAVPDKIDTPFQYVLEAPDYKPHMQVGWLHPTFGHMSVGIEFSENYPPHVKLQCHRLVFWMAGIVVPDQHNAAIESPIREELKPDASRLFRADPVGFVLQQFNRYYREEGTKDNLAHLLNPPDLSNLEYKNRGRKADPRPDGVWTRIAGNADLYGDKNLVTQAAIKGLPILERALQAYRLMGVSVTGDFRMFGGEKIMDGLTIRLPVRKDEPGQQESHEIHLNRNGITVTCGYTQSDEKYQAWQMREAKRFLAEVQEYEERTYQIGGPQAEGEE